MDMHNERFRQNEGTKSIGIFHWDLDLGSKENQGPFQEREF